MYTEFRVTWPDSGPELLRKTHIPAEFHVYWDTLGPARLRALRYRPADVREAITEIEELPRITEEIRGTFKGGQFWPLQGVKETLSRIYQSHGLTRTKPKASDLEKYISVKRAQETVDGRRVHGYRVLTEG